MTHVSYHQLADFATLSVTCSMSASRQTMVSGVFEALSATSPQVCTILVRALDALKPLQAEDTEPRSPSMRPLHDGDVQYCIPGRAWVLLAVGTPDVWRREGGARGSCGHSRGGATRKQPHLHELQHGVVPGLGADRGLLPLRAVGELLVQDGDAVLDPEVALLVAAVAVALQVDAQGVERLVHPDAQVAPLHREVSGGGGGRGCQDLGN